MSSETRAYEFFRSTRFFSGLDGLRCLAVTAVVWHHAGNYAGDLLLLRHGSRGVDLFFVISGFLITTLLLREREEYGRISLRNFFLRRALRIFPLYFAVVFIYVVAVWIFERDTHAGHEFFQNLPFFLTYTSNWFVQLDGRVIFYFSWSLAAEEQFYLVWPSIEKLLTRWWPVCVIAAILVLQSLVTETAGDALWKTILLSVHPAILGGVLLAHVLHEPRTFSLVHALLASLLAAPTALLALLAAFAMPSSAWAIWVPMVLLVGAVTVNERNGLRRLLTHPAIRHVGVVSYGVYLLHMLSFNAVKRAMPGYDVLWFPATLALAVLLASLSYRYYESWFLGLKARFAAGGGQRRVGKTAATIQPNVEPTVADGARNVVGRD